MKDKILPGGMPSPPNFLVEAMPTNGLEVHVPARKASLRAASDPSYNEILNERKTAEADFARVYSEYGELTDFNRKLLKRIHFFERFRGRIREAYNRLQHSEGSQLQVAKLIQKDLFIAERTVESLQLENSALLATIQTSEEREQIQSSKTLNLAKDFHFLQTRFAEISEKLEEKNGMLLRSEDKLQETLCQLGKNSADLAKVHLQLSEAESETLHLREKLQASHVREADLAKLNTDLANSMVKLQKRNHELIERLKDEEADEATTKLIKVVLPEIPQHHYDDFDFDEPKLANDIVLAAESATRNEVATVKESAVVCGLPAADVKEFYKRWTHIINELSSHSTPMNYPQNNDKPPST